MSQMPTVWRTGQIDPCGPFKIAPMNGREGEEADFS
jgi:hypothetical protein